jgi:putative ABC transport system substrate-binding protein
MQFDRLNRRTLITLLGGATAAWPLAAHAQERLPVVGILRINPKQVEVFAEPFRRDMKELGWEDGRNVRFEFVWAGGRNEDVPWLARDLARQADIIVVFGNLGTSAAPRATETIPIVSMSDDMVGEGLAASMARPGGHTTGVSIHGAQLDVKRLELLHEFVPQARRIAVLKDPTAVTVKEYQLEPAAARLDLELAIFTARNADEVGRALDGIAAANVGAVSVLASPMLNGARRLIVDRLRDARLPSIYEWPETTDDGGLLGYGAPIASLYRRIAEFVDKILRGAHPADLPIEQPTKLELAVNLRTAKAIGLALTPLLLSRADRVIE